MSTEEQFDFYWKEIFDGLPYNPIEFNVYRFDQSMSLPGKVNKLYDMFKVLAMNNQEVMDYLKEFVETFDEKLYETLEDVLNVWMVDGRLADIVRVAISEEVIEARTDHLGHTYLNLKERLDVENEEITTQLAHNDLLRVNFLNEGGKVNDPTYDSTPLLQELDRRVKEYGHVEIEFPPGQYYFKGTYTQSEGVSIKGASEFDTWNQNGRLGQERGTVFNHVPESQIDFLTLSQENLKSGYVAGGSLQGLYILGNGLSKVGLDLTRITNGTYKNLLLLGFETGIHLETTMKTTFDRVATMFSRRKGLHVTGIAATTTRFYDCYFGQSVSYEDSYPIKLENSSVIGFDFYSCLIESTKKGMDLGSGNDVSFMNLYSENIPAHVSSAEPIVKIGEEPTTPATKGNYTFVGGNISGTNGPASFATDNKIIYVGEHADSVTFIGSRFARGRKVIEYDSNANSIVFMGCSSIQVTEDLVVNNNGKIKVIGFYNASSKSVRPDELNDIVQKTSTGSYRIRTRSSVTKADLTFETGEGKIPLSLDSSGNIRFNYTGVIQRLENTAVFGEIDRPDFSGAIPSIKVASLWAEDVDGKTRFKTRDSLGAIYNVGYRKVGIRPSSPGDGEIIIDSTIKKIIWYDKTTNSWYDSMGNQV